MYPKRHASVWTLAVKNAIWPHLSRRQQLNASQLRCSILRMLKSWDWCMMWESVADDGAVKNVGVA